MKVPDCGCVKISNLEKIYRVYFSKLKLILCYKENESFWREEDYNLQPNYCPQCGTKYKEVKDEK